MKIAVILRGGMGNQMFQYALGRRLSIQYNAELYLAKWFVNNTGVEIQPLSYLSDIFNINVPEISQNEIDPNWIVISDLGPFSNEHLDLFNNLKVNNNYIINGYWQNEKYISGYEEYIRNDFKLVDDIIEYPQDELIVQVRRGDYATMYKESHLFCDTDWYIDSINKFPECKKVIFISDDKKWCQDEFTHRLTDRSLIFKDSNVLENHIDMAHHNKFVISNSTFAWWGAFYSNTCNVICPRVWLPSNKDWETARSCWTKL